jgi:hypothetical protein
MRNYGLMNEIQRQTQQRDRRRLAYIVTCGIVVVGALFWMSRQLSTTGPITDPSYYTGAFTNHNGDLVSPDGKILKKGNLSMRQRPSATGN